MMWNSPLDQFALATIVEIYVPFLNVSVLNVTTMTIYLGLVVSLICLVIRLGSVGTIVGNGWSLVLESITDTLANMVRGQINTAISGRYLPLVSTLFILILVSNLVGMVPYNYAISASLIYVIGLSSSLWLGLTLMSVYLNKEDFFGFFVPGGTPLALVPVLVLIELLSYSARAISLGLRLGANTLSGHLLMSILGNLVNTFMSISTLTLVIGMIPLLGIFAIVILEFAIACIQAYVFAILTSSYLNDSIYLH